MPTLAQAETVLVGPAPDAGAGLVGAVLARVGYDVTGPSPVALLATPIAMGLLACDVTPLDVTAPNDGDLAKLAVGDWPKFLDIASLLLLESAAISSAVGGGGVKMIQWEDYRKEYFPPFDFSKLLTERRSLVLRIWGYGAAKLGSGTIQVRSVDSQGEF
jgi:hypothetical protein